MSDSRSRDIAAIIRDGRAIDRAIVAARRDVILHHRRMGAPLVIWRDGKVVEVDPETAELPVYEEEEGTGG